MSLPVMMTVREAFQFVNHHGTSLVSLAAIPFAVNAGLIFAYDLGLGPATGGVADLFRNLVSMVVNVPFLTAWHRLTLLGAAAEREVTRYRFRPAETRFLGYLLVIYGFFFAATIVASLVLAPVAVAAPPGASVLFIALSFAAVVVFSIVGLRWSLVLPATAMGLRLRLREAWRLTRGNGLALFGVMVLVFAPLLVLGLGAMLLVGAAAGAALLEVVLLAPGYYFTAVFISALSMIFRDLAGYDPAAFTPEALVR